MLTQSAIRNASFGPSLAAAIATAAILLCMAQSALAQSGAERRGLWFARLHCAQCHAVETLAIVPPFRTLHLKYAVQDPRRPLAEGVHPRMPLFRLTPAQTMDLMAYFKSFEAAPSQAASRNSGN
jgi:hypothetical protein